MFLSPLYTGVFQETVITKYFSQAKKRTALKKKHDSYKEYMLQAPGIGEKNAGLKQIYNAANF